MPDFWRTGPITITECYDPEERDFCAYLDGVRLPRGVHVLSQESQDIMRRIAERSAALEAGFTKRVS